MEKDMEMQLKCAGELMIPLDKYPHLPYWFTLRQAIAEMEKTEVIIDGRKSLPRVILVFNEKYQLLGTVRRRDILRGLEPSFLAPSDPRLQVDFDLASLPIDKLLEGIRSRAERPIRDVMLPIPSAVEFDDHIMKVIYEMVTHDVHMLPVLQQGRVVGVVRTVDVFHAMAQVVL